MPLRNHVADCARCRQLRTIEARYLCRPCYETVLRTRTVDDWPAKCRPAAELIASVQRLRGQRETWGRIAARLGYANGWSVEAAYRQALRRTEASR